MPTLTAGNSISVRLRRGDQLTIVAAANSTAQVDWRNRTEGGASNGVFSISAGQTKVFGPYANDETMMINCLTGTIDQSLATFLDEDTSNLVTILGAQAPQPTSGTVLLNISRSSFAYRLDFTLDRARIPVTDAAGSGSYGTLKLFNYVQQALAYMGCRQDYTAFAEGAALTTAAGDAVFKIGVGSVAKAAAADGALAGATDDEIGGEISVTLSGGTGVGTTVTAGGAVVNGTGTASSLNLNWSGTAATIDASSHIDVTGTISVIVCTLGDD